MKQRLLHLALLGTLALPVLAFTYGGWAVITVDDLPEYLVSGKATDVSFLVRQHGATPMRGLSPRVTFKSGSTESTVNAKATDQVGRYVAAITPPRAGDWTVRIESGFGNSETTLLPLRAVATGAPAPRPLAEAERGHQLFIAKGCNTCHMRAESDAGGGNFAPNLSGRRYPAEYVAKFLADPEKSPLSRSATSTLRMPKLDLKEREIASLVVFLNSEGTLSKR
jgi:hypothetical protein